MSKRRKINKSPLTRDKEEERTAAKSTDDSVPSSTNHLKHNDRSDPFSKSKLFSGRHGLTIVLIMVYVTQAYYMKKQWNVMDAQLVAGNNALIASERAWVLLDSLDLKRTVNLEDGKQSAYQVIFRNFGKGPATDVSICADATSTKPSWKSYNCEIHTEIVAAPGGEVPIRVIGPKFPDVARQLFIWGAVKYKDQFQIARYTEFCVTPLVSVNERVGIGPCERSSAK